MVVDDVPHCKFYVFQVPPEKKNRIQSGQETDGGTANHHVYSSVIRGPIAYFWRIFKLSGNVFSRSRAAISVNKVSLKASHISKSKLDLVECNKAYFKLIAFILWKLCLVKEEYFFVGHPVDWVFFGYSSFLPQGMLTRWVGIYYKLLTGISS